MKQNYDKNIIEWLFHTYFPEKEIVQYSLCDGGIENSNFLIETKGARYILKIFEGLKNTSEEISAEVNILIHLKQLKSNVPEIFVSQKGETIIVGPGDKKVILMEYIDGMKYRDKPLDDDVLFLLWRDIAILNQNLAKISSEYAIPETHVYDLKYIFRHPELRTYQPDYADPSLLSEVWTGIDEIRSTFEELPTQLIHNDLHSNNIIFKDEEIYFIDFSDFLLGSVAQEIAISLFSWCFHHFWHPEGVTEYLRWYESVRKLTTEEKECLFGCIECRMLNIVLAPYIPESGLDIENYGEWIMRYYAALERFHEFWKENFMKLIL